MTPKYRLLDNIDWDALDGTNVKVEVSANYLILKPLKAGEPLIILAQAVKPRAAKSNGQPATDADAVAAAELAALHEPGESA